MDVLIVEDDPDIGARVDLIVLDVMLPGISGFDVCRGPDLRAPAATI